MLLARGLAAWVLFALLACGTGCDPGGPEGEVIDQYKRGEQAIAAGDVVGFKNTLTTSSAVWFQEVLELACEGERDVVREKPYRTIQYVLALRNRVKHDVLKTMSVDDFIEWQMREGFLTLDEDVGLVPYKATITGDRAKMQYGMKVETGWSPRFRRRGFISSAIASRPRSKVEPIPDFYVFFESINGFWYQDMTQRNPMFEEMLVEQAKEEKMKLPDYLAAQEEDDQGSLIKNIWTPPFGKGGEVKPKSPW